MTHNGQQSKVSVSCHQKKKKRVTVFAQRYDKHELPACKSVLRREREPFIIKPCHGALATGLAWASLTHYTVRPVGRRCAGRGAVMVCATTMERGHRRKTGVDVCWGVGWVTLRRGQKGGDINHGILSILIHHPNSPDCNLSESQPSQANILLLSARFHF